ncbi:MAG: alpha/beta hydrolase [Cyanothece sp. SIO1E1]|nr:alpha/beta hydrolase [Cyanothece sp. SIO1E1]
MKRLTLSLISACFTLVLGVSLEALSPRPAVSAERLTTYVGPLQFSIAIDDLETFAQEGTARGNLKLLLGFIKADTETQLRQVLQRQLEVDPVTISRITYVPMVEQIIQSFGRALQTNSGLNGFYAVRAALILAAADNPDGWTVLDMMRRFPTRDIRVNLGFFLDASRELTDILVYRAAAVDVISQQARQEALAAPELDYAQLPDLSQPGSNSFTQERLTFDIQAVRRTLDGFSGNYQLRVDLYTPDNVSEPPPLVIFSHGFGGRITDGRTIGTHLASHGLAVAVPEHIGTTDIYRTAFLEGGFGDILSPIEYISRQLDIIYTIDQLEKLAETDPRWTGRFNPQQVGVMGASFGGLTAMASAGASFNPTQLKPFCSRGLVQFNPSFLLQCHARFLPPSDYNFADPRIKAALPLYPMGALLFGPEGVGNIDIPVLMFAGSDDILAPSVYEQIPLFSWIKAPHKHLALMVPGNHFSTSSPSNIQLIPAPLRGPDPNIGRFYLRTLSVAFFKAYLENSPEASEYLPYLNAAHAEAISREELRLHLVQSLTPAQLAQAYGGTAPGADRIDTKGAVAQSSDDSVLAEIQQTGLLNVAIRSDAAPFGYINQEGAWTGYCFDLADALAAHLSNQIDRTLAVDAIYLPSNLNDRFELVRDGTVHLECGPDIIRTDIEGVTFSEPFFVSGTQLLVTANKAQQVNANSNLVGLKTGVLSNTTTEQFVQNRYPDTDLVPFKGITGATDAVQAVTSGSINTFANDGVLLRGELARQNLAPEDFALIPEKPLTCDFYGLVLPDNDAEWRKTVNQFNRSEPAKQVRAEWFGEFFPQALSTLNYCTDTRL